MGTRVTWTKWSTSAGVQLYLIEDCAEAFGTTTRADTSDIWRFRGLRFFATRTITTGEGGMVVAKSSELLARAYHLKTQAVSPMQNTARCRGIQLSHDEYLRGYWPAQLENATAVLKKSARSQLGIDWACKACRCRSWKKRLIREFLLDVFDRRRRSEPSQPLRNC